MVAPMSSSADAEVQSGLAVLIELRDALVGAKQMLEHWLRLGASLRAHAWKRGEAYDSHRVTSAETAAEVTEERASH